jgi:hypothetical protein
MKSNFIECITITNVGIYMKWKLLLLSVDEIDFQARTLLMLICYKLNVRNEQLLEVSNVCDCNLLG